MDPTPHGNPGPLQGADVAALRATALAFARTADVLELVDLRAHDGLAELTWSGPDATRVRDTWEEQHAVTLHMTAALLRTGALLLLQEADDQEAVSAGTGTTGTGTAGTGTTGSPRDAVGSSLPGGTGGAPTSWAGLRERLTDLVGTVAGTSAQVVRETGAVGTAVDAASLAGMRVRAAQSLGDAGLLARAGDFSIGPVTHRALGALGVAGTAVGAYDTVVAYRDGDWWGTTDGAVSTALGVAATAGSVPAAAAGVAWAGGAWVGTQIHEGMQGTTYGDHFERRMEGAFDRAGALGMVWTPVALAQAGIDSAVDGARELASDVAEAYRRVENAVHTPTPWGMQTLSAPWPDDEEHTGPGEP